jgi:Skp family chaperone for outer membrane proteins
MNKLLLLIVILLSSIATQAQNVKIGYTNAEYLVTQLPEYASIQKKE